MFNYTKAEARGLIQTCDLPLQEPWHVVGVHPCVNGHLHHVYTIATGKLIVDNIGFEPVFLRIWTDAYEEAKRQCDPYQNFAKYERIYDALLREGGYGDILDD